MSRPITRKVRLKEGYYIEVKKGFGDSGIKIRRDTFDQIKHAYNHYKPLKEVSYLGKFINGEFLKEEKI